MAILKGMIYQNIELPLRTQQEEHWNGRSLYRYIYIYIYIYAMVAGYIKCV
jgi:hypothetical protein